MKKNLLLVFLFVFCCGITPVLSQNSTPVITGPKSVPQFTHAEFTVTRYLEPSSDDIYVEMSKPQQPYGYVINFTNKEHLGNNMYKRTFTIVFHTVGTFTILGGYKVTVTPNPLKLENPFHICPYGTQLLKMNISSYYEKKITIIGNSSARISNTGVLTYDPNTYGSIKVKLELILEKNY